MCSADDFPNIENVGTEDYVSVASFCQHNLTGISEQRENLACAAI
jgi:hypothetical protein